MPALKITKRSVDSLQPASRDYYMWDEELTGFGIKVTPNGRKVYVAQYRLPGLGRRGFARRLSLGEHGRLTPEQARQLARRELGKVAHGSDPSAERTALRRGASMKELGEKFLDHVNTQLKARTAIEYRRLWDKHVLPVLGSRLATDVSAADVRRLHRSLATTPYLANRVVAMLGSLFSYAEKEGVRTVPSGPNPTRAVDRFKENSRERFLTAAEFGKLGAALATAESIGLPPAPRDREASERSDKLKHRPKSADTPIPANPFAVAAIRLLMLTGCRENEILSLRWGQVDFECGYLRLSESKTGRSNRPLSQSAATLLETLPRLDGNPFVLPGREPGQHIKKIKRFWHAVRHAAGLGDVRLHDLRHSYASIPAAGGESLLVLRSLLGHKNVATTERYAHLGDDPVKSAADRTGHQITAWLAARSDSGQPGG